MKHKNPFGNKCEIERKFNLDAHVFLSSFSKEIDEKTRELERQVEGRINNFIFAQDVASGLYKDFPKIYIEIL